MKIPKYIDNALIQRRKLACKLDNYCQIVDEWLDKNNIEVPCEDSHGGVELYVNPIESELSIRESIKRA